MQIEISNEHPCVFIHGMWGSSAVFNDWYNLLNGGFMFNLIGHHPNGSSEENHIALDHVSIDDYVRQTIRILDGQVSSSVNLIGHSLGGLIAQIVASRRPELVKNLVLLASVPPHGIHLPFQARYFKYWWKIVTGFAFKLSLKDTKFVAGRTNVPFGWESGRVVREVLFGKFRVPSLRCRTLVIAGDKDQLLPPETEMRLAKLHRANYKEIWAGEHMLPCDPTTSEVVRDEVVEWLNDAQN
ncbi:MAG: alpha/beta hydrolase [Patescibacteria group bacterium]